MGAQGSQEMGSMGRRELEDDEKVPVDEDWIGGTQSYLSTPGVHVHNDSPVMPGGLLRCATGAPRGGSRPNIQEREVLAGLTYAHCTHFWIWQQPADAYSRSAQATGST